jgi:hypothetical protein
VLSACVMLALELRRWVWMHRATIRRPTGRGSGDQAAVGLGRVSGLLGTGAPVVLEAWPGSRVKMTPRAR